MRRGLAVVAASAGTILFVSHERDAGGALPDQQRDRGAQARQAWHRETPDDPPASIIPRDNPLARSMPTVVQRGDFTSVQVNVDEFGQNIVGDAANEPSLAVDPTDADRIVIGWRQFDTITSNFRQAGYGYSHDGGQSWTFPGSLDPGVFRSDPVLDADAAGNIYYLSLTLDYIQFDDWECNVFKSLDGGLSFEPPGYAYGGDKPWMAIDRTGGIGDANVYVKWQSFGNCCGLNTFTRSTDGGLTFMYPMSVPLGPSFGTLAVGPDGEVYAAGIEAVSFQNFQTIVVAVSTDARDPGVTPTFDFGTVVDLGGSLGIGGGPNPDGLLGQVWVAVDHSGGPRHGDVYMLSSVDPPGADPLDVMFSRSTDGGASWSPPVRVNDDPAGTNAWQWFGTMAVAPSGRIDAIWNDTRSSGVVNLSELFYTWSTDGGATWSPNVPLSPMFDSYLGWPNQAKLGDYYDMISDAVGARVAYAATFNGEQDVYFLRIEIDCDGNGVHDGDDEANCGPDEPWCDDCNANDQLDGCDILPGGPSEDLDGDGVPDECGGTLCDEDGDCNDADGCTYDKCVGIWCSNRARLYGDVDRNGTPNVFDTFCILDLIAGESVEPECDPMNADLHPCAPNGTLNVFDIFAVLDAIAGINACSCPAGP